MVRFLAGAAVGVVAVMALGNTKTKRMLNKGRREIKKGIESGTAVVKQKKENLRQKIHDATAPKQIEEKK